MVNVSFYEPECYDIADTSSAYLGEYGWARATGFAGNSTTPGRDVIPDEVFDRLQGGHLEDGCEWIRIYRGRVAALDAIKNALPPEQSPMKD